MVNQQFHNDYIMVTVDQWLTMVTTMVNEGEYDGEYHG